MKEMKLALFTGLFFMLFLGCNNSGKKSEDRINSEELYIYQDLEGNPVRLSAFNGKRILVNYWESWCMPCLLEFPSLVSAQENLKDDDYVFLFVSSGKKEEIEKFKKKKNYPVKFLQLQVSLASIGVHSLPTSVIYDRDGNVFKVHTGAQVWDDDEVIKLLRSVP